MRMPSLQTITNPHHQNENVNNINANKFVAEESNQKSKVSIFGNYKEFIN
jgi:hypothetical protein